ncbi:DeoR/GlpR family DNA-binding transcription regulator [Lederbergia citrea]|uniref:DeoR/GlpR transcriptional regulator n=1 Tax=Lederbergia citrea TaxID=2833581 RepID=A0A942UNY0_9BACI|nr:DeoR/GlpR family DNA-binding transcription regulator [Lederbergia citrea]MBS4223327.1 DeoR/GlpR transcriptional regulator [Lederbergia citrea]
MIPYVRREKIMDELENKQMMYIEDLMKIFDGVSESTIRRDLKILEDENHIIHLHGGAVKLKLDSYEIPVGTKKLLYKEEKEKIAKLAASLVEDEEVIYIDSGTTCTSMVKYIKATGVRVITSNIQVVNEANNKNIESCIIVGGEVNRNLESISGALTDATLRNLNFDKAFLGASGFGIEVGINTPDFREASKKSIVNANSKKCFVLTDSSKFNKTTLVKAFEIQECTLITSEFIPELDGKIEYLVAE